MATQNARVDSNFHKSLLAVDETTGETRRLQTNSSGALKITGTATVTDNTSVQKVIVSKAGTTIGTRHKINLIEGSNVTLTVADNAGSDRVDVTVTAATGAPTTSHYLLDTADASLPNSTVISYGSGLTVTGGGGASTISIDTTTVATLTGSQALTNKTINGSSNTITNISLTTAVTGVLPVANGGTNASSASITAFNNITGYTASGATGTTSTNLVFSTSPTLVTPTLGVATGTRLGLGQAADSSAVMASTGQYFSTKYAAGNTSTALTINWDNGNVQACTATGNVTFTFSNPKSGGRYMLIITQDATGSRTYTWPAAVKWSGGTTPTGSAASKIDVITFAYDGTNYYGGYSLNY